ncbi:hypothetical protein BCR39DRAFT_586489 [Naematelia encephala]|uniref:Uncharacterized protein n=1 Tax=Naematelia encephala TaxID=71784 RepID=A0A1Y2BFT5_9TREE|nr:hypothetical protein BCR39DRAFT_586489 [Naematelia encephala]
MTTTQPAKPLHLDPENTYIQITTSPTHDPTALNISGPSRLQYLGPVGELKGEHIFQLQTSDGAPVKRATIEAGEAELGKRAVEAVRAVQGVKGAKIMEFKHRAKR